MTKPQSQDLINAFFEEEIKNEKKQAKKLLRLAKKNNNWSIRWILSNWKRIYKGGKAKKINWG